MSTGDQIALGKKMISHSATCTTGGANSVWSPVVHVAFQTGILAFWPPVVQGLFVFNFL